jgi:predicted neuraminidase
MLARRLPAILIQTWGVSAYMVLQPSVAHSESIRQGAAPPQAEIAESTLIFPMQQSHVHSSSIVELPDRSLLAAWFQGSGERDADDVCIMAARKPADVATWSEPFVLADTLGHPDCNPVLWLDGNQRLWLFWSAILSNEWESSLVKYCNSTNYLASNEPPRWEQQGVIHVAPSNFHGHMLAGWHQLITTVYFVPRAIHAELSVTRLPKFLLEEWKLLAALMLPIPATIAFSAWRRRRTCRAGWKRFVLRAAALHGSLLIVAVAGAVGYFSLQSHNKLNQRLGWMTANKPLQLASGEIVLPLYSDRFVNSIMAISSDGGITWDTSEPLVGYGNIQPTLVVRGDGTIVAWMREAGPRKRIRFSTSSDRGRTWSTVEDSELPNPGAKVAATTLASGHWAVAYNPLVEGRHALSLSISYDEGTTWQSFHVLDEAAPKQGTFSYPCVLESSDGSIHVTYSYHQRRNGTSLKSIKHVRLRGPGSSKQAQLAEGAAAARR